MHANAPARPEQTLTKTTPHTDSAFIAGQQAARAWYAQAKAAMISCRDDARCALVRDIEDESEAAVASFEFDAGFASAFRQMVSGGAA